jgi:hypothetical protein
MLNHFWTKRYRQNMSTDQLCKKGRWADYRRLFRSASPLAAEITSGLVLKYHKILKYSQTVADRWVFYTNQKAIWDQPIEFCFRWRAPPIVAISTSGSLSQQKKALINGVRDELVMSVSWVEQNQLKTGVPSATFIKLTQNTNSKPWSGKFWWIFLKKPKIIVKA